MRLASSSDVHADPPALIPRAIGLHALFADQAAIVTDGARVLENEMCGLADPMTASERLRDPEHQGDAINHEVKARLDRGFVPPYESGEVVALAGGFETAIDRPDRVGRVLEQIGSGYGGPWRAR